jgi:hypothetical protein
LTLHFQRAFVNLGQRARRRSLNVDYRILIVNLDVKASLIAFDPVTGMQKLAARRNSSHVLQNFPKQTANTACLQFINVNV